MTDADKQMQHSPEKKTVSPDEGAVFQRDRIIARNYGFECEFRNG